MFAPTGTACKPRRRSVHGGMIRLSRRAFLARLAAAVPALLAASRSRAMPGSRADGPGVRLFLAGDVMTGRGIDQVLPHHVDPELHEPWVGSALEYVALAEAANGPIPRPVDFDYVWGDGLARLEQAAPHARIINLETAVTTSDAWLPKGINYRMHPDNVPVLTAAGIHCAVLANNHVLDWGETGLLETLDVLHRAGIATAGAGADEEAAAAPAVLPLDGGGRVLVFACGTGSSGVPRDWAATPGRPGVTFLPDLAPATVDALARRVARHRRPGDVVVVSIHWGGNWGFAIPAAQRAFARRLVEAGAADIVHGHSSHHVKGIEVHRDRLILYGCGDLVNDYEGIRGHPPYRDDLGLMYFPRLDPATGALLALPMAPMRLKRFRLHDAGADETRWLLDVLNREGKRLGTRARPGDDGLLYLEWD